MTEIGAGTKARIEKYLNLYPEVTWDRYVADEDDFSVFGWIDRPDGRSDFYLMNFKDGVFNGSQCSSARYSEEFWRRICTLHPDFPLDGHIDCQRVEDLGWDVQCVHLTQEAHAEAT